MKEVGEGNLEGVGFERHRLQGKTLEWVKGGVVISQQWWIEGGL